MYFQDFITYKLHPMNAENALITHSWKIFDKISLLEHFAVIKQEMFFLHLRDVLQVPGASNSSVTPMINICQGICCETRHGRGLRLDTSPLQN